MRGSRSSSGRDAHDAAHQGGPRGGRDRDLKEKWDFGTAVTADLTLYAGYTDVTHPSDASDWAVIGLFIAGIIAAVSFAVIRHPAVIIAGIAMIALAALVHFGVIAW